MCPTTVLLSDHAAGCFCLHCQCPVEPGLASCLCVACYLDAVYSAGEFDLPPECECGRPLTDDPCPCGRDGEAVDWPPVPEDDAAAWLDLPLGVPCPRRHDGTPF